MFSYTKERISDAGLEMSYHLTPWDKPVFQGNTGAISSFKLRDADRAFPAFDIFRQWCMDNRTLLISCRLGHEQLAECEFLGRFGFRFIELNYQPTIKTTTSMIQDPAFDIGPAIPADEDWVRDLALGAFNTGRLHADPMIDSALGDRRYATWVANALHHPAQTVLIGRIDGRPIGFMIVESPSQVQRQWTLSAIDKSRHGTKTGPQFWRNVLAYHAREGATEVISSVSTLNVISHNIHVSLGFRFPAPTITLHWCPFGPIAAPAIV